MKRILALLLSVLMLILVGCKASPQSNDNTQSSSGETTKTAPESLSLLYRSNDTLNPYAASSLLNRQLSYLLYDPLVKVDNFYQPKFILAKDIDYNGKSCTITLNDAYFSDGTAVTAEDVVYCYGLAKNSALIYSKQLSSVSSMVAEGSKTISVKLTKADPYIANLLDFPIFKRESEKAVDEDNISLPPVGSGRYIPDLANERLVRNSAHINGKPSVEKISLLHAPDSEVIEHNLESNYVSLYYTDLSDGVIHSMTGTSYFVNLNNFVYLGTNMNYGKCKNEKMRYLISEAINRTEICNTAYHELAAPATGIFNPVWEDAKGLQNISSTSVNPNLVAYLKDLGYNSKNDDGYYVESNKVVLTVSLICYRGNSRHVAVAETVAAQLKKIGIKVNIQKLGWEGYMWTLQNGQFDLYVAETKILNNMDVSELVIPGGSMAYGIYKGSDNTTSDQSQNKDNGAGDDVTEGLDDNFSIQYTLNDSIKGFYNGEYSLVDIINSFNAGMPLIPVCYRYGLTTCDVALEINEISSVSDPFFGISMIGSKR